MSSLNGLLFFNDGKDTLWRMSSVKWSYSMFWMEVAIMPLVNSVDLGLSCGSVDSVCTKDADLRLSFMPTLLKNYW
jgi:hypothetical protein